MFPRDQPRPISKQRGPSTPKFHVLKRSLVNRCLCKVRRRSPTLLTAKPMPKHRLGRSLFLLKKTGFLPSYCQISTDLDKNFHTPIVVWNTLVGRLRPRSARGRLQAKPERLCFCNTCNASLYKSYMETTDRRDFGGKP